jgi:hypothetical protein
MDDLYHERVSHLQREVDDLRKVIRKARRLAKKVVETHKQLDPAVESEKTVPIMEAIVAQEEAIEALAKWVRDG